jgi:RES domain-containing protein
MNVFRITLSKFASLTASGLGARWNSTGVEMIYTSSSLSLACLENIAHRKEHGRLLNYRTIIIDIPDIIPREIIRLPDLPGDWINFNKNSYSKCRVFGDNWINKGKSAVLQVPSAIIKTEFNYLINPSHSDFKKIKIISSEPFFFDPRIK